MVVPQGRRTGKHFTCGGPSRSTNRQILHLWWSGPSRSTNRQTLHLWWSLKVDRQANTSPVVVRSLKVDKQTNTSPVVVPQGRQTGKHFTCSGLKGQGRQTDKYFTCGGPSRSTVFSTKIGAGSVLTEFRCFCHCFRATWTSSACCRYAFVRLLLRSTPNLRRLAAPLMGDRKLCICAHHPHS